jgi:hypothetical protein
MAKSRTRYYPYWAAYSARTPYGPVRETWVFRTVEDAHAWADRVTQDHGWTDLSVTVYAYDDRFNQTVAASFQRKGGGR